MDYLLMDSGCPLPSCLHGGPIPLSKCSAGETAYVETVTDLPAGSVARGLQSIAARYGACGMMAVEEGLVVGKLRFYPQALLDRLSDPCVQQEHTVRPLLALDLDGLQAQPQGESQLDVLRLCCFQVAEGFRSRGVSGGMLDASIDWAREAGWRAVRVEAILPIRPLLDWSGHAGRDGLLRRGFAITGERLSPELREGVVAQRLGAHGEGVKCQWADFAHLSDDEAAFIYSMTLRLPDGGASSRCRV